MIRKVCRPFGLCMVLVATIGMETGQVKDIHSEAGTSAFPFLKISIGARAVGMGGAFTGLADDESSLYYNPAGVAALPQNRWIAGYHNYFAGIQSGFVGCVLPLGDDNSFGAHISYLNYGELIETDDLAQTLGTFGGSDLLVAASFARRLTYNLKVGLTAKFIYESIHDFSATGLAFDFGVRYNDNRDRFTSGVMVQNLGQQLSALDRQKYRLPLTVRTGVSYRPRGLPMVLVSDVIMPVDNDVCFAIGGEYHELKPLYLRLGWNSFGSNYRTADSDDSWAGLSFGVGFDHAHVRIAYAISPSAELGRSHRITATGAF